jgi:long-chain fatty acid transport protein
MDKLKLTCTALLLCATTTAVGGGLLTNTNQNIAFLRNPARDGAIGIDGVYSNPAGVAFLDKGLHLSFNFQNVYQTRTINSGMTVPSLKGTPYYMPLTLNGGDADGVKQFKGEASVPIVPSIQAALNYDNWGFQASFAVTGGGGKCTFNDGLGSFERQIAMIPALLYAQGITTTSPGYSVSSYIYGRQYVFGLQLGSTYKINEHIAVYGGARFNYVMNKYEGNIVNISANINGANENLYNYFGGKAETYNQMAFFYKMRATEISDATQKAAYEKTSEAYSKAAEAANSTKEQFADKYLECRQTGWGVTPILGIDMKWKGLNIGARYEFTTKFNIQNNTSRDDTGLFKDGVNTPNDLPGVVTIGAQYEIIPSLRVSAGYHHFFDKEARMANDKQKLLSGNTNEYLAGAEYDINKTLQISAGIQRTKYGLGDGSYLNDMSFTTSSYSIGLGAGIQIMKKAKLNIGYFWTNYETINKEYTQAMSSGTATVEANCTDEFTRTNKVLGIGLDIDL